jgi:adenylosuccinate synthase
VQWADEPRQGEPTRIRTLVSYHLPTGGALRSELCYVNAGAVVDIALLLRERANTQQVTGHMTHIMIHPNAAMLLPEDRDSEISAGSSTEKISSTQKGVGSAISRKVRREAMTMKDWRVFDPTAALTINVLEPNRHLRNGQAWSVEVPQGLSLGLNHGGFYPYCTSREVSVAQALSDANIHPRYLGMVALCMRTFPIRVGSLPGQTSGGYYHDQKELDWTELPVPGPELTTVTKRPRRIFSWSRSQYRDALNKTLPAVVFLNFVNYFRTVREFEQHMADMDDDHHMVGVKPHIVYGLGPTIEDVTDDPGLAMSHLMHMIEERIK